MDALIQLLYVLCGPDRTEVDRNYCCCIKRGWTTSLNYQGGTHLGSWAQWEKAWMKIPDIVTGAANQAEARKDHLRWYGHIVGQKMMR